MRSAGLSNSAWPCSTIMAARFEVRQLDPPANRRILGNGIGICPKEALFVQQMDVHYGLFPFLHVLTNEQYDPTKSGTYVYTDLEMALEDFAHAEAIFELGTS